MTVSLTIDVGMVYGYRAGSDADGDDLGLTASVNPTANNSAAAMKAYEASGDPVALFK